MDRARDGVPPLSHINSALPVRPEEGSATIDLHVHSTASDGSLLPEAVVARALAAGLGAIALTDHDTVAGIPAAVATGDRLGLRVVVGCEFSAAAPWGEMHVLGYFLPSESPVLDAFLERCRADRIRRGREMVTRLRGWASIWSSTTCCCSHGAARWAVRMWLGPSCGQAAPPTSVMPSIGTSAEGGPRSSRRDCPSSPRSPESLHSVGGLVSVAHLKERGTRSFLERLKHEGLDAVEIRHPSHDPALRSRLTDIALRLGLLRTGGSDWHGDPAPGESHGALGSQEVPLEWLDRLDAVRGSPPTPMAGP